MTIGLIHHIFLAAKNCHRSIKKFLSSIRFVNDKDYINLCDVRLCPESHLFVYWRPDEVEAHEENKV